MRYHSRRSSVVPHLTSVPKLMQTPPDVENRRFLARSLERNFVSTRFELIVVFLFAFAAALSSFVEIDQTTRARSFASASGVPSTPSESSRNAIPRFSAIVDDSGASLSESMRLRTRNLGRSRVARSARGGSSSERQPSFRASFRLLRDRFHVSLEIFSRLWREKTSPRPLWLFILVLLN